MFFQLGLEFPAQRFVGLGRFARVAWCINCTSAVLTDAPPVSSRAAGCIRDTFDSDDFVFFFLSHSGKAGLPDPELVVDRLLKRRTFRPDPQGSNLMFAFFAQHFTHQFFKTFNRMGLGFTKALSHGVSLFAAGGQTIMWLHYYKVVWWNGGIERSTDSFSQNLSQHEN